MLLSTHIVEDNSQTCRNLAVLDAGRPVFRGTVAELTAIADGQVWSVATDGPQPDGVIVSALPHVLFAPISGWLTDRRETVQTLRWCSLAQAEIGRAHV